ncbi:hypothetical protein CQW23_31119 [Capsicum baccatum]|uniref:Uncharacterized protein n=1 Tax=Capsicum baccatum TaxID=33114 RepID=A0A2G2V8F0_CAPBA|nr:hypothetical protein CQW23_31119 [Capsicum baccatum]
MEERWPSGLRCIIRIAIRILFTEGSNPSLSVLSPNSLMLMTEMYQIAMEKMIPTVRPFFDIYSLFLIAVFVKVLKRVLVKIAIFLIHLFFLAWILVERPPIPPLACPALGAIPSMSLQEFQPMLPAQQAQPYGSGSSQQFLPLGHANVVMPQPSQIQFPQPMQQQIISSSGIIIDCTVNGSVPIYCNSYMDS